MRLDKALLDLAAEQRSCVADWQVRQLGASKTELARLKRSSRWEMAGDHVLVVAGAARDDLLETSAAVLAAGPGAVLAFEPGTALWGLPGFRLRPAVIAQEAGHAWRRHPLGKVHDLVVVPERWVTWLHGIRVVRPELAAYQLCGVLNPIKAARTFDAFWARGLLTGASAKRCLDDLARRGRNGTAVYREIIKARGQNYVPPTTNLESRVKELADEAGIKLRRQVNLGDDEQWAGRVDFIEDDVRLVIEIQSELHHASLSDAAADAIRRANLEAAGFHFLELWDTDIWTRPGWAVAAMRRAILKAKFPS